MKKEIYSWGNKDYTQTITWDAENDLFEITTTYNLKYGIDKKITYIDRHEVEAMSKALEKFKEGEKNEEGTIKTNSQAIQKGLL